MGTAAKRMRCGLAALTRALVQAAAAQPVALDELAANDQSLATAVELVFFGGMKYEEAADSMSVSRTRFAEDLRMAKAWLKSRLGVE